MAQKYDFFESSTINFKYCPSLQLLMSDRLDAGGWVFWDQGNDRGPYEDVYSRTRREDWIRIVRFMVDQMTGSKQILDIGSGDGHSTRQILERLRRKNGGFLCDLLEPSEIALKQSLEFLSGYPIGESFATEVAKFQTERRYDAMFTVHSNYYWAKDEDSYNQCLDQLMANLDTKGVLMVVTLPQDSDHYSVALIQRVPLVFD